MKATVRRLAHVTIVDLSGRLTIGEDEDRLRDKVVELLDDGQRNIVLNVARVKSADSAGLDALFWCHKRTKEKGGWLRVASPTEMLWSLIQLSRLDTILDVFDDESSAIEAVGPTTTSVVQPSPPIQAAEPPHQRLLRGSTQWNAWRTRHPEERLSLDNADLRGAELTGVNLQGVSARGVKLDDACLDGAKLIGTDLSGASLTTASVQSAVISDVDMSGADLGGADLRYSKVAKTSFREATMKGINLSRTRITDTDFTQAALEDADLTESALRSVRIVDAQLTRARFSTIRLSSCVLSNVDLSACRDLDTVIHDGPSSVGLDTFRRSEGRIDERFLRGCGIEPWEVIGSRLYQPELGPAEICELTTQMFDNRASVALSVGGVFVSYSHSDSDFVDEVQGQLEKQGAVVWRDVHDLIAGSIVRQISESIHVNNVVLLILSSRSTNSDWVEFELEKARERERLEGRDVVCPIALDDSWKRMESPLWRQVRRNKVVLDFSNWRRDFQTPFKKLVRGMKLHYS